MDGLDKEHYCEDCEEFDETEIPADCLAGHGKVAFRHRVCPDFVIKDQNENSNGRKEL
jgi:hypothetical protein